VIARRIERDIGIRDVLRRVPNVCINQALVEGVRSNQWEGPSAVWQVRPNSVACKGRGASYADEEAFIAASCVFRAMPISIPG
jgi:hypothetical protein